MNIIKRALNKTVRYLNGKVKATNWYKNQLADKNLYPTNEWYREHDERNFDIVNIGSSSAIFAFDYSFTELSGFNWAGKPQSLELGYKLLKNFFSILKCDGVVCISLSPFTGLAVPWAGQAEEEKFYGVMDYSLFDNFDRVAFKMGNPVRADIKTSLKRLVKDVPARTDIVPQSLDECKFDSDAQGWIALWKKEFGIENLDLPVPWHLVEGMNRRANLMAEMVHFCIERNLRPVVVLPPVHKTLARYFSESFVTNYLSPIISAAKKNGAKVIDMLYSPEFETSDFYNSFFLNPTGSRKFMDKLIKAIE